MLTMPCHGSRLLHVREGDIPSVQRTTNNSGGDALRLALDHLHENEGAGREEPPTNEPDGADRLQLELRSLLEWAKKAGCALTPESAEDLIPLHQGFEHRVFGDPLSGRVIKLTHPNTAGYDRLHTPSAKSYLERLVLSNEVFADDVHLEGIMESDAGIIIVTSQPFRPALDPNNPHPLQAQIYQFLMGSGFCYEDGAWVRYADRLLIDDAHPGNFILSENNALVAIDLKLRKLPG